MIETEQDIIKLIQADAWMMGVLRAAKSLDLPDWWVCAGFVRSKIWDVLHGFEERTPIQDVDVIYFDKSTIDEEEEKRLETTLNKIYPSVPWSVKNEARMHLKNDLPPYKSSEDAIGKFPETVTALGVRIANNGRVVLSAPHGVEDVLNYKVRPTPLFNDEELHAVYVSRINKKNWKSIWYNITVE